MLEGIYSSIYSIMSSLMFTEFMVEGSSSTESRTFAGPTGTLHLLATNLFENPV